MVVAVIIYLEDYVDVPVTKLAQCHLAYIHTHMTTQHVMRVLYHA